MAQPEALFFWTNDMSFQMMTAAVSCPCESVYERVVLTSLANRASPDDGKCYPSHSRLAEDCCISVSCVKDTIKKLSAKGYVEIIERFDGDQQLSNYYVLTIGEFSPAAVAPTQAQYNPPLGATQPGVGRNTPTKQSLKHKDKHIKTSLPENFAISQSVKTWANEKSHRHLFERLEHFKNSALAKDYKYVDWDAAFRNAISADWAKLNDRKQTDDPMRGVT